MTGFIALLRKDLREITRTWRLWVLPLIVAFSAVTSVLSARYLPQILGAVAGDLPPQILATLPAPSWHEAYAQWNKNLFQLVLMALIISLAGMISSEVRAGTAVTVLTTRARRAAFVISRCLSSLILVLAATVAGVGLTWALTWALFGTAPLAPLLAATGAWLVLATLMCAVTAVGSAAYNAQAAAAGLGLATLMILALAGSWKPAARYTPAGLVSAPDLILDGGTTWWPVVTGLAVAVTALGAAVMIFSRREL